MVHQFHFLVFPRQLAIARELGLLPRQLYRVADDMPCVRHCVSLPHKFVAHSQMVMAICGFDTFISI